MSCRSGTIVGESIFGVALVPSLGTLGLICSTPGFYHFIRSLFKRPQAAVRPLVFSSTDLVRSSDHLLK